MDKVLEFLQRLLLLIVASLAVGYLIWRGMESEGFFTALYYGSAAVLAVIAGRDI